MGSLVYPVPYRETKGDILPIDCQFIKLEPIQLPLINQFYKRVYKKGIARKNEAIFILKQKEIICSAKLKTIDTHTLLCGVACDPQFRKQGYATQLIDAILARQVQPVYCFPYSYLCSFYAQLGFIPMDLQMVPDIIRQKYLTYSKNRSLLLMVHHH